MSAVMRAFSNVDAGVVKAEIEIAASPTRVFQSTHGRQRARRVVGSDEMYRTSDWTLDLRYLLRRSRHGRGRYWRGMEAGARVAR